PDCVASRSLLPRSWPTEPTMVAPMATALIGVQASQPVLATRPALLGSDVWPAALLSATAFANVPPNQAARPRSCSNREGKFGTTRSPYVRLNLPASGTRRPDDQTGSGDRHRQPATHLANPRAALF